MKSAYTQMLQDPSLPLVIKSMQKYLDDEAKLREKFYNDINETQKAEFINGEIILHSPATYGHNLAMKRLIMAMESHVLLYSLGYIGFEKMMIHLSRNSYEPDICFFTTEQASKFAKSEKLFPAPSLIVEVLSPSTEKYDRDIKFNDYRQHNVKEYWIVDPINEHIEQYVMKNGKYRLNFNARKGLIESEIITGFKIDVKLLFDDDYYYEFVAQDKKKVIALNKTIAEKDSQLAEKDNQLAEKEKIIAELMLKLKTE